MKWAKSIEWRLMMSEKRKGENNPHYKNGIRTGKRIMLSIQPLCELCGDNEPLNVHHIDEDRNNNKLDNLLVLCKSCHSKQHRGKEWSNKMLSLKLKGGN